MPVDEMKPVKKPSKAAQRDKWLKAAKKKADEIGLDYAECSRMIADKFNVADSKDLTAAQAKEFYVAVCETAKSIAEMGAEEEEPTTRSAGEEAPAGLNALPEGDEEEGTPPVPDIFTRS